MNRVNTAKLSMIVLALVVGLVYAIQAKQQPPTQGAPAQPQGGNPQVLAELKNVQVLKDMTRQQVIAEMNVWTKALGVECNFCHVRPFETDTPRKQTARLMERDYVLALKHKNGTALTCNDCHQGQVNPLRTRPFENAKMNGGLQVLDGKDHDKLMHTMHDYTQELGVRCDYCHKNPFGEDTPRKQIARFMMTNFTNDLVKQDGSAVDCRVCHQGHARPLDVLPFPQRRPTPPPAAAPAPEKKP